MENRYDFAVFIKDVMDLDYLEIIEKAEQEVAEIEQLSYGRPGAVKAREMGSTAYAHKLKEFLFWLRFGRRPSSASEGDFHLYKIVALALVEKGAFKPSVLEMFDE
jgi:hypothetical protein